MVCTPATTLQSSFTMIWTKRRNKNTPKNLGIFYWIKCIYFSCHFDWRDPITWTKIELSGRSHFQPNIRRGKLFQPRIYTVELLRHCDRMAGFNGVTSEIGGGFNAVSLGHSPLLVVPEQVVEVIPHFDFHFWQSPGHKSSILSEESASGYSQTRIVWLDSF